MLRILQSNRLETLADGLIESLAEHPAPLPQAEVVLVPNLAVARWLEYHIADRLGVCARIEFPYAAQFIWRSFGAVLPAVAAYSPFDRGLLALRLFEMLRSLPPGPDTAPLRAYLRDADPRRRLALAERIAAGFDQYLVYRPDWLEAWGRDQDLPLKPREAGRWQRLLWQTLMREGGRSATRHPKEDFFEALAQNPAALGLLPARVRLFAPPILPPLYVEIFTRLSRHLAVDWYVLNPCREYWADIVSERRQAALALQDGGELQWREVGHALLASWGTQARDNLALVAAHIGEDGIEDQESFEAPGEDSLLHRLQSSILELRDLDAVPLADDDESLQIHACHGLMRQLEVLHDRLLMLFERMPDLRPHQVLVQCPDIEVAAPMIEAVFGGAPPARHLPWQITGRARSDATPLLRAFAGLLQLPTSRFTAAAVLDFLAEPVVARRYELDESELERLHDWLAEAGVRWGLDAAQRVQLDLPPETRNSWLDGLLRLLLGYALPSAGERLFEGVLPCDDIEGSQALVLGKLLRALADLVQLRSSLENPHTLEDWASLLEKAAERLLEPRLEDARDERRLREALRGLREDAQRAESRERVPLDVARSLVEQRLRDAAPGGVPGAGISFCGIGPLRGLPFRVVCLVGLDDGAFPRNPVAPEFDLISAQPRLGDRAGRADDRGAFLDALLSAREVLLLAYTGRSIRDNAELPPSVLVAELLEYLGRHTPLTREQLRHRLLREHPLQAFSPTAFAAEAPASFAAELLPAARAVQAPVRERRALPPFFEPERLAEDPGRPGELDVEQLTRFLRHPVRALLRDQLGLQLEEAGESIPDEEPFTLERGDTWALDDQLLAGCLAGEPDERIVERLLAGHALPHGQWGRRLLEQRLGAAHRFAAQVLEVRPVPLQRTLPFALPLDGLTLTGSLRDLGSGGLFVSSYRKLGVHDLLGHWPRHLALNLLQSPGVACCTRLLTLDGDLQLRPVPQARELLLDLLALYREGLCRPLPFYPRSAYELFGDKGSMDKALAKWVGSPQQAGERDDGWYRLLHRGRPGSLPEEFETLAQRILGPILQHLEALP